MKIISLIGRVLFALPFIAFGINHFRQIDKIASYVPEYLPFPEVWVYVTAVLFILAGISIGSNIKARIAGFGLAIMIAIFVVLIYLPEFNSSKMAITTYVAFMGAAVFIASKSEK
jgi:putative oxidoreductase